MTPAVIEIANCLDVHDLIDLDGFNDLQEAYNKLYKKFIKYAKKSMDLRLHLRNPTT